MLKERSTVSPLVVLLTRVTRLQGVRQATIATRDGLLVAAAPTSGEGAEMRSASMAAIFGSLDRALPSIGLGEVDAATVETSNYTLFLHAAGNLVLTAVADRDAVRDAVRGELARVANVLARVDRAR